MSNQPASGGPLLEVTGLRHRYGDRLVLSLDDWVLRRGENQLLLGPSGSGKTTLLSVLTGLLTPTEGEVRLDGQRLSELTARERDERRAATFGLVFQDHHLISSLALEDNLAFARYVAGQDSDPAWTNMLLDQLGLADKRQAKPATLSRGEAQRAALARAAIARPPILIADEPSSALDDANTDRILTLMTDLCAHWDATLLVASHDQRLITHFDNRLHLGAHGGQE